jgi:hypothetical protein
MRAVDQQHWAGLVGGLQALAQKTLFSVGGAPRSGTTWVQQILDAHPAICCRGEGLVMMRAAEPMGRLVAEWRSAVVAKNAQLFQHTGGFVPPDDDMAERLWAMALLLALQAQRPAAEVQAIGEKTPENVFLFPRLRAQFPHARLIVVARDPRDVLASAWHQFHGHGADQGQDKIDFIRRALPSLDHGMRVVLEQHRMWPDSVRIVTYEQLSVTPGPVVASLFGFLGVAADADIVQSCLAQASFQRHAAGRKPGQEQRQAFLRKGVVGDWSSVFSVAMGDEILERLGWGLPLMEQAASRL